MLAKVLTGAVVGGAVDLRAGGRRGADQQWSGAGATTGRAMAQGQLWLGQRGGESVRGVSADRGGHLPAARTAAVGVSSGCGRSGAPGHRSAIAAPGTAGELNAYTGIIIC